MRLVCGYSYVCEGIPDEHLEYGGGNLLQCSRCKGIQYKDKDAQRRHWKMHKSSCRVLSVSELDAVSKVPTLEQCKVDLKRSLLNPKGGPELCHLIRRIRSLMDSGAGNVGDMALEFHSFCRGLIFHPQNVMLTAMSRPGMVELMLTDNVEELLNDKTVLLKELAVYNGRPSEEYIEHCITDEVEKKRVEDLCVKIDDFPWGEPSSVSFCYLYFNLLVAAAIQGQPSMCSIHDGQGRLRGSEGPDKSAEHLLATAALRRALALWSNPLVLESCGDAMAPAASLALTAVSHYSARRNLGGTNCREHEIAPGLTAESAVLTCLHELEEHAGSAEHSVQLLKVMAELSLKSTQWWKSGEKQPLWLDAPAECRAKVALGLAHYIMENAVQPEESFSPFGRQESADLEDCNILFKTVCGMANPENETLTKAVFEEASTGGEHLGPKAAGRNDRARAFFYFLARRGCFSVILDVAKEIKSFNDIKDLHRTSEDDTLAKEKDECFKLARGEERHADWTAFMARLHEK